ncbi:MAG TPA: hypothetical protein VJ928_04680 [Marivita sp.]|nr:hypothetical protein [Marivita sp.]
MRFNGTVGSVADAKTIIDAHAAAVETPFGSEFTIGVTGLVEDALNWV